MAHILNAELNNPQEHITLCKERFIAHPSGALIWPAEQTLIIADMYLASSLLWNAMRQTRTISHAADQLGIIKSLLDTYPIRQVIALGHSFRRLDDPHHLDANDLNTLYNMQKQVNWIWVAGKAAKAYPSLVGGQRWVTYQQAGFTFACTPRKLPVNYEIAAGTYPMARLSTQQSNTEDEQFCLPCFASNGKRLMMPAFGGAIAAQNILSDEFLPYFGYDEVTVQVVDKYKTLPVPHDLLKTG